MQDYSFDPALKRIADIAKLRVARDPEMIRAFIQDNRLNTQLFQRFYRAGDVLRKKEKEED